MCTAIDTGTRTGSRRGRAVPAYGFVDTLLGLVLFYIIVDRATPTVVGVFTDALPGVSPSVFGLGMASVLWFVVVVTVLDQAHRQLAALGLGSRDAASRDTGHAGISEVRGLAYLVLVAVGGGVAAWTFERAMDATVTAIRVVATLDTAAFTVGDGVAMVVFFVSFGVATRALDRLLVGGIRTLLSE